VERREDRPEEHALVADEGEVEGGALPFDIDQACCGIGRVTDQTRNEG